jgi:hypothetical protein
MGSAARAQGSTHLVILDAGLGERGCRVL